MEQIIGMTDTAFLGRVGEVELGAAALGSIFYTAVFMLGLGFGTGAQILMSRRNGEGRFGEIGRIFHHSIIFLMVMAGLLFTVTCTAGAGILTRIISSPDVAGAAVTYLHWRAYGYFFSFACVIFRAFYVSTTRTRVLTLNSVTMVAANVIFNYILIFGNLGCPALGIAGAAIGSSLANAVSLIFFIVYTRAAGNTAKYGIGIRRALKDKFDTRLLNHIWGISVWTMAQNFLSLSTWFIFFLAVEHLGQRELAVTNVVRNISSVSFMTLMALGATANTLTGNLIGQGDTEAVRPMLARVIRLAFFILIPMYIVFGSFTDAVLSIFTSDTGIIAAGRGPVLVLATSYLFNIPAQIYLCAVQATGNTRAGLCFELVSLAFYTAFVVIVIFIMRAPLPVCWLGEHVYAAAAALLCWLYMRNGNWRHKRI